MVSEFPPAVPDRAALSEPDAAGLQTFDEVLLQQELPVLVAFFHAEAGSCTERAALATVAERFGSQLRVAVAELVHSPQYRNKYHILGTPTFLFFAQGVERDRILGKADEPTLQGFICQALGLAGDSIFLSEQNFSTCQE